MRVLIFVWFLRAWAKPGLTAHPATGHQEILVSASGQAVMRREAKEAAESSLDEQSVVDRALKRAAELSRKGSPEEALYRESLLKKVRDILEHDGAKPAGLQQREARRGARNDPVHHDVHSGVDEHGMMWHGEPYMDSVHHYDDALHGDHVHADHMADWTHEHLAAHGTEHDAMMHDPYHGHESFDMTLQPTDHGIFPHMGDEHDMQDLHLPADHLQLTDAIKESDKAGIEAAEAAIKMGLPSKKVAEVAAKAAKAAAEAEGMTEEQQATVAKDAAEKAQWMGEDLGSVEHLEQMKQLFEHGHHEVSDHSHHIDSMEHIDHLEHPLEGGEHPMDDFEQMDHMGHDTHVEHPEVMSFSLQGCSKELCDAMKGSYHETGWKDGRPIYSKDDHEVSVFFADRGAMSGWWFGKSPHSEEAYAFHPGKEPLPPSSGWHVPPEGGIDESMRFLSAVQEVHHLHYEPEEPVVNLTGPVEVKDAPMGDEVVSTLPPSTGLEEMPVLQVLGCKDARTAALVDGLYEAAGITNGLPWFKKHGAEGSVWLYHYADVAAGSVGWWIGSNPAGRVHIYAFNPSQERFPPKTGWKAPWWGHVDNEMVVQALSEGHEDEAIKTADEVNLTLPEHMKESHPEQPKAMPPGEVPAEAAKLSSQAPILKGGKELADMVFGTDTGVIPKQPPSEEMLTKLAEDPSLAKKALNQTVRMLGAAVRRLESGEAFDRLAGALQPIAKHDQKENASAGDEAPVDGSAAVPLLKEVDQVAAAANEAAEKARLWKEAEIAERNAKQAAEEAKKRVEKVTVAAAQEEAEKAIADAADGETAKDEASKEAQEADADVADKEAEVAKAEKKIEDMKKGASAEEKEDAEKELEEAKQEVKAKEEELRSAKEALENLGPDASKEEREEAEEAVEKAEAELKEAQEALERRESAVDALHVTADEEKAAEEELRRAQLAVKSAAAKAETLEKRAEEIRVKHTEGQDNALYSDSVGSDSKGVIVMGSEPKSDNEKILEAKLDAMQAKIEGLERVQLKEKLKDQLASLAEIDAVGPRKPKGVSAEPEGEGQAEEEKPTPPKKKGSWNRIAIFVTVAVLVGAVAVGALYQLMLVKRLKKGPKADKQPLTEDAAANPDLGAPAAPPATTSS